MSKKLIERAKKGDLEALNKLIDEHKSLAYSIAFKYLKNNEDAEDVTQNAFIIVLKSITRFRSESKFSTWLYKIIYHECLKALKGCNDFVEYVPQFSELENELETDDKMPEIDELVKCLTANEYTVTSLFYLQEKSIKEIKQITAFSEANIKVILHRSRTKMKLAYENRKL